MESIRPPGGSRTGGRLGRIDHPGSRPPLVRIDRMAEHASPSRIARAMLLEKSTLSRDLARMVAQGWVRRRSGPGRSQSLEITARGQRLVAEAFPRWEHAQAAARDRFGQILGTEIRSLAHQAVAQFQE